MFLPIFEARPAAARAVSAECGALFRPAIHRRAVGELKTSNSAFYSQGLCCASHDDAEKAC
jgi:hypothetical protein